mgnify:CR=1 FL=1
MVDKKDFERFFRENYSRLYYFAINLAKDEEVCRDIVSESFAQLWKHREDIPQAKFLGYISQTVYNKSMDHIRKMMARDKYAEFYRVIYGEVTDEENVRLEEMETRIQQIYTLMDGLTPQTRKILELCYFKNKTYMEVAVLLGVSRSAIKKHVMQALKIFREEMLKNSKK